MSELYGGMEFSQLLFKILAATPLDISRDILGEVRGKGGVEGCKSLHFPIKFFKRRSIKENSGGVLSMVMLTSLFEH